MVTIIVIVDVAVLTLTAYNMPIICLSVVMSRYSFNDSYVSESSAETAVSDLAYVLFYKRKQGELKWAGIVPLEEGLPDDP